jgi:hypothetical protein
VCENQNNKIISGTQKVAEAWWKEVRKTRTYKRKR